MIFFTLQSFEHLVVVKCFPLGRLCYSNCIIYMENCDIDINVYIYNMSKIIAVVYPETNVTGIYNLSLGIEIPHFAWIKRVR